jgi:hypothetical protein
MSIPSIIFISLAWLLMMGGVVYYITYGSKGDLNVLKGFTFILGFVTAGAFLIILAMIFA